MHSGGTGLESEGVRPTGKNNRTDMADRHARNQKQEHHKGYLLIMYRIRSDRADRSLNKRQLGTSRPHARTFNSMATKTTPMLFLVKRTQTEVYLVRLYNRQDGTAHHHLPFARRAPTLDVVEIDLPLPEFAKANRTSSARHIKANTILNAMVLKQMRFKLLV